MPRPKRLLAPGALYHVFARGNHREPIFRDDADRLLWLNLLHAARREFDLRVYAYCLMTNHIHLALETRQANLDRAMRWIQLEYSKRFNQKYGLVGHLFEDRYKSRLVDRDNYLLALVRYIHLNPVKAGMVSAPSLYPWSSHRAYAGEAAEGFIEARPVFDLLGTDPDKSRRLYQEFMESPVPPKEWRQLDSKRNGVLIKRYLVPLKVPGTF